MPYWTRDTVDENWIMEDAHLRKCETPMQAMADFVKELQGGDDVSYLEDSTLQLTVMPISELDCWSKVPADWTVAQIDEHVKSHGAENGDIVMRNPGQHPGGDKIWLSLRPMVYGVTFEIH